MDCSETHLPVASATGIPSWLFISEKLACCNESYIVLTLIKNLSLFSYLVWTKEKKIEKSLTMMSLVGSKAGFSAVLCDTNQVEKNCTFL